MYTVPRTSYQHYAVFRWLLAGLLVLSAFVAGAQYNVGDLGAVANGNWTAALTWRTWNGTIWTGPAAVPGAGSTVHILAGNTVVVNGMGPYSVQNLTVEAGAKLWTNNNATNVYLNIYGTTLRCDGQIGDGATFDGLSFNIEGANVLISGTGQFDASRLRKSDGVNVTTNLSIAMDVNLRFNSASTTQIYNNYGAPTVQSRFNVTVEAGATVNLTGAMGSGNVAIDGINGISPAHRGGTFRILGTLNIPGILYLTTDNPAGTPACRFEVGPGGYVRAGQINSSASGAATSTLLVEAGGTLELTGAAVGWEPYANAGATNNTHTFQTGSTMVYSGMGDQLIRLPSLNRYGDLVVRGSGVKTLTQGNYAIWGDVTVSNADGNPVLDVGTPVRTLTINSGNWSNYNQSGFEERTGFVIFQNAGPNTIATTGGEEFYNLRIFKTVGQSMVLGSPVTVLNNFEFNRGILELNANRLWLQGAFTSTTAYAGNHYIQSESVDNGGQVRREIGAVAGGYLYPFGVGGEYIPFTFQLTAGDAGSVTVATYGTGADNLPWPTTPDLVTNLSGFLGADNSDATADRFWQVDVTGTPTAALTFTYRSSELPVAPWDDPFSLRAQRWNTPAQLWEDSLEGNAIAFSVTANTVTAFGPFALAPILAPLPIELLFFTARANGAVVDLEWATASERDNAFFTVLRSADGVDFEELFRTAAIGDSQQRNDYFEVDDQPLTGWSYYKLLQTDHDGSTSESQVEAVYMRNSAQGAMVLFPNPAVDIVTVSGIAPGPVRVRVVDATGRTVLSQPLVGEVERTSISVSLLASGRYMLLMEHSSGTEVLPFIRE